MLEQLAEEAGKATEELVCELVSEALSRRGVRDGGAHGEENLARRQHAAMEDLLARLNAINEAPPDDGLSNRDHDQILYGTSR